MTAHDRRNARRTSRALDALIVPPPRAGANLPVWAHVEAQLVDWLMRTLPPEVTENPGSERFRAAAAAVLNFAPGGPSLHLSRRAIQRACLWLDERERLPAHVVIPPAWHGNGGAR